MSSDLPKGAVRTERGFVHLPRIDGTHGAHDGSYIEAYESSSAEGAAIWVRAQNTRGDDAAVHLDLESAGRLRDQLDWLIANHYQLQPRPEPKAAREPAAAKTPTPSKTWLWDGSAEMASELIDWGHEHGLSISFWCEDKQACDEDRHMLLVRINGEDVKVPAGIEVTLTDVPKLRIVEPQPVKLPPLPADRAPHYAALADEVRDLYVRSGNVSETLGELLAEFSMSVLVAAETLINQRDKSKRPQTLGPAEDLPF